MQKVFDVRSIELHDFASIWVPERVKKIVDFMVKYDMNTLIFHQNDIVDFLSYPSFLFTHDGKPAQDANIYSVYQKTWDAYYYRSPNPHVFLDEKPILVELMRSIIHMAKEKGIAVFFQTKELWFSDMVYETPVVKNGVICPSEPYWWETYLPVKYREFFANFPEVDGIITSTGTRESRASLAHGKCKCDLCRNADMKEWQKNIIMGIYKPLHELGKKLVVRDFSYHPDEQNGICTETLDLPGDIIYSIKNVPQDFYQTFPHNKLIGNVGAYEQWIEYESMGEYFGFGVVPCELIDDVRSRIQYCKSRGAEGFTSRVDWEALPNHSAFDTVNALNVYAAAMLSVDDTLTNRDVYHAYVDDANILLPGLSAEQREKCVALLMDVLGKSSKAVFGSCYFKKFLFGTNSKIPADIEYQDFVNEEFHGLHKWFPEYKSCLDMNRQNIAEIMEEKREAIVTSDTMYDEWACENPGFTGEFYSRLLGQLDITKMFTRQFYAVAKVYFYYKGYRGPEDREALEKALVELAEFEDELRAYKIPVFEYPADVMLCADKLHYFRLDAEKKSRELW